MNLHKRLLTLVMTIAMSMSVVFAYTAPADDQIEEALTDPSKIAALIEGASPEEAADVLRRVVLMVQAKNLSLQNKQLHVARFASVFIRSLGEEAGGEFAQAFLNAAAGLEEPLLQAAFVGFQEGARILGSAPLTDKLKEVSANNMAALSALENPTDAIGIAVIRILRTEVGVPIGSATPVLSEQGLGQGPPVEAGPDEEPAPAPAPAPAPGTGTPPPPPPPVPQPYAGQS